MERRTEAEWCRLIDSAIQSGQRIASWCQEHGIKKNEFYRHCRKLGYIRCGERTNKWTDCRTRSGAVSVKSLPPEEPFLVPVPKSTIYTAAREFREDGAFPVRDQAPSPGMSPPVYIQRGAWKVFAGDGFRRETLRDVLEVVANAQGS